jgi:hypothetical protein
MVQKTNNNAYEEVSLHSAQEKCKFRVEQCFLGNISRTTGPSRCPSKPYFLTAIKRTGTTWAYEILNNTPP